MANPEIVPPAEPTVPAVTDNNTGKPPADTEVHPAFVPPTDPDGEQQNPPADEPPADEPPAEEPTEYNYDEIKFSEVAQMSEDHQNSAKEFFKAEKVSPELAQKLIDYSETIGKEQIAQHKAEVANYKLQAENELRKDSEFGGKNFSDTYAKADLYLTNHCTDPELKALLVQDGWVHPKLIKHFASLQNLYHSEAGANDRGTPPTQNDDIPPWMKKYPQHYK